MFKQSVTSTETGESVTLSMNARHAKRLRRLMLCIQSAAETIISSTLVKRATV